MAYYVLFSWWRDFRKTPYDNAISLFRKEWYATLNEEQRARMKRLKNEEKYGTALLKLCAMIGLNRMMEDLSGERFCNPDFGREVRKMVKEE